MKKAIIIFFAVSFALFSKTSSAITVLGHKVLFKGEVTEWSEPVIDSMSTDYMEKKGIPAIPLQVRVRVVRKVFRGCRYEVEVTNLDPTRKLTYSMTGLDAEKYNKRKIKPGETIKYGMGSFLTKNCPDIQDCANGQCEFDIQFKDVNVK